MTTRKAGAFARRHKKKLVAAHAGAGAIATAVAFLLGAFAGPAIQIEFGQRLDKTGQQLYHRLAARNVEQGQRVGSEALPAASAAELVAANNAVPHVAPQTLATPQPQLLTSIVRNYSTRHGAHPLLEVVHDAEMPNAPGVQDLRAIAAWFNNPAAQASSNYATDADGNTILMVPLAAKAWTQAFFNPWAISDELLGYASQTRWPDAQLRTVAELFARDALRYGIPIQRGLVEGCQIIRPGIVEHRDLGACGGGHHDAGPNFPLDRFIALEREYAAALAHPTPKPSPKKKPAPRPRCTVKQLQRALNARGARLVVDGVEGPKTKAALKRIGLAHLHLGCRA